MVIDDLDMSLFPFQIVDVPVVPGHGVGVFAGAGPNHLAVQDQVDAGLAWVLAAADQEADEGSFDGESRGGELAARLIRGRIAVHQALAQEAAQALIGAQGAAGRFGPEGLALDFPVAIRLALEVGEDHGRPFAAFGSGRWLHPAFQTGSLRGSLDVIAPVAREERVALPQHHVLQPAGQLGADRYCACVLQGKLKDRGRQGGIFHIQGNEGREGL